MNLYFKPKRKIYVDMTNWFLLIIKLLLGFSFVLYTTPQAFSFKTYRVKIKAFHSILFYSKSVSNIWYSVKSVKYAANLFEAGNYDNRMQLQFLF